MVHVIQARELAGENFDGTADPVVEVTVLGRKQQTRRGLSTCDSLHGRCAGGTANLRVHTRLWGHVFEYKMAAG